ncbi:MAG: TlpA family protein disulfide reductase [Sulfurimonas sp.]|nr:TlpA family protein disulfide reductase [Sulfurimonas sp.]
MFKNFTLSLVLASTFLFLACSNDKIEDANSMISKDEYILTSLEKKQYTVKKEDSGFLLKGAEGKVVIFDIFATWCPPCRGEATHLSSLQEKYKDDLIIIGISIENNILDAKLQDFRRRYDATYMLVNSKTNRTLADAIVSELDLGERYPIPIMAVYKDGKYINHFIGATEEELIESDIKIALGR